MLLPKIFKSDIVNYVLYFALVLIVYNYYVDCCDGHGHGHSQSHGHDHVH